MKATKRITKNTIDNLIKDIWVHSPSRYVSKYDLSVYTDKQIEELNILIKRKLRNALLTNSKSKELLEKDLSIELRDRRLKQLGL